MEPENFLAQRLMWRMKATQDLTSASRPAHDLVSGTREVCALIGSSLSGANWAGVRNAEYLAGLTAGFLRSHINVLDLAEQSEVADATTLLRQNIEAVARMRELENAKDPGLLFKRTPNLNSLHCNVARLYGDYSEIAHSSHPRVSQLLGTAEDARPGWVSMHPKFSEHTLVLITNAFVVYAEFYHWARGAAPLISADFPLQKVDSWTAQLAATAQASEAMTGIEPAPSVWKIDSQPLWHLRVSYDGVIPTVIDVRSSGPAASARSGVVPVDGEDPCQRARVNADGGRAVTLAILSGSAYHFIDEDPGH